MISEIVQITHFIGEEVNAQRSDLSCSRPHSQLLSQDSNQVLLQIQHFPSDSLIASPTPIYSLHKYLWSTYYAHARFCSRYSEQERKFPIRLQLIKIVICPITCHGEKKEWKRKMQVLRAVAQRGKWRWVFERWGMTWGPRLLVVIHIDTALQFCCS